jgi:hypothetical protein
MNNLPFYDPEYEFTIWHPLHFNDLERLQAARRQVHQALQIVGAVGRNLLPAHPWDIFGNFEWNRRGAMWLGWPIPGRFECRAGLCPVDMRLHLTSPFGESFASFALDGMTFADGFAWMKEQIQAFGIDSEGMKTELPYDIPAYAQASGEVFDVSDTEAFVEVASLFHNSNSLLDILEQTYVFWQNIRTWPHHMDISTRRKFVLDDGSWHMGVGFGPGDDHNYKEPYWHLTCYSSEGVDFDNLPELPAGMQWHKDKWLGIVMLWSQVLKEQDGEEQFRILYENMENAMEILHKVRGGEAITY